MSHHFLRIAWLTTRFTLPKIYSAWLFASGGGDLKFYTEGLYPQVKSLTYFLKKKSALGRSSPFAYKAFLRGKGWEHLKRRREEKAEKSDLYSWNICKPIYCVFSLTHEYFDGLKWLLLCGGANIVGLTQQTIVSLDVVLLSTYQERIHSDALHMWSCHAIARIGMFLFCQKAWNSAVDSFTTFTGALAMSSMLFPNLLLQKFI